MLKAKGQRLVGHELQEQEVPVGVLGELRFCAFFLKTAIRCN